MARAAGPKKKTKIRFFSLFSGWAAIGEPRKLFFSFFFYGSRGQKPKGLGSEEKHPSRGWVCAPGKNTGNAAPCQTALPRLE